MPTHTSGLLLACFDEHLAELERQRRRRRLAPRLGHDFASNDYLGLAGSSALEGAITAALSRSVPIGAGGSRLLRGNHPEHQLLEEEAAQFFGSESSLFFSSGYAANSTLLSTLPQRRDLIVHDALIHASSHEGIRLARAPARSAIHNDAQSFADILRDWRKAGGTGQPWLVVESLYSMEGDKAPLADLMSLADQYGGFLIVDEAHATGVFGHDGRGLAERFDGRANVVTVRTCGKALGCEGALICAPRAITEFLINRGRGFIFSTAPSPLIAAAVRAALTIIRREPERRQRLHELSAYAAARLEPLGARDNGTQILPLVVGDPGPTMELADRLQELGFDARGIRPPTVPEGTSRLRISITLNVDEAAIGGLANAIAEALE
nr:8-amino-7-oxononanoate synthase [Sphingomonas sp.]